MKITKEVDGGTTKYFYDGVLKYRYHDYPNFKCWEEYDGRKNIIRGKYFNGLEWNSEYKYHAIPIPESEVKPFVFSGL